MPASTRTRKRSRWPVEDSTGQLYRGPDAGVLASLRAGVPEDERRSRRLGGEAQQRDELE